MMPGVKRRARLLVDWNLQLLFGRDASELGKLGQPGRLAAEPTAGGVPAGATTREDRPTRLSSGGG
jgi:NADH dehydrogenase